MTKEQGLNKVIIEGDSKLCVDVVASKGAKASWKTSYIITDTLAKFRSFALVNFNWVPRYANIAFLFFIIQ